ncbi:tRNA lysidine(34) synthetase TilS [Micromonospora krabiensis]|uniref:tRNA(Ile)-lysidine synthase n=1 Tax=Micromonospora krabiensis TaxID=307121 RepID=A0A1C3N9F6_9ACTN|nr:tRNA lysidine(34) synthetase TilS [Micromonospora krabiensis]SBV29176.1 tRNA(Ile)-lysidine synthase [Micromonospora krabiensis]
MAALAPPVAAVRTAVRRALTGLPGDGPVLVACSGGADSLALAAATAFVAPRLGRRAGLVTVDHGLQEGSAERAAAVAAWADDVGLTPVESVRVAVAGRPGGPEAAAREARYEALVAAAVRHRAAALLTGHTRDDQAETVLLALARGSGPRGLAGMPARRELSGVPLLRPLLAVTREQTRAACAVLGLEPWQDPHNSDPAYARARVRADVLPVLVDALGPGVLDGLARTAALAAADAAALDDLADAALAEARHPDGGLAVPALAALVPAVRGRVLHAWARELGATPGALSHRHVAALEALVSDWRGQGAAYLPGGRRVLRRADRLFGPDPA